MENIKRMLEEYDKTCERLRKGEYDNLEEESAKYKKLKSEIDKAGIKFLDGLNLDTLIFE